MDKAQYFYRTVIFTRNTDDGVALVNIFNPSEKTPLEPWLGTVISLADGEHTFQELVEYMANNYPAGAPADLEKTLDSVFERLLDSGFIKMSETKVTLPYYLAEPIESLDIEKALKLIHEDGYTQH